MTKMNVSAKRIFLFCAVLAAAGCGGGGGSANIDCDQLCAKQKECDSFVDTVECASDCATTNRVMSAQFGNAVTACYQKSCDQIQTCIQAAISSCNTNLDNLFNKTCQKVVICNSAVTLEQCKAQLLNQEGSDYLKCFSTASLNTMGNCAQAAACETFDDDFNSCVQEKLGINLGDAE